MAITIRFFNRNTNEDGLRIYRSEEPFTESNLPSVYATLPPGVNEYVDTAVSRGQKFYYLFETFRGSETAFSQLVFAEALGTDTGPGAQLLIGGDSWAGFYGEVPASQLINGTVLASQLGLTAGTAQNSTEPWLKFALDGETVFVARKTLRHSISWDHIRAVNGILGDRTIKINGDLYQVRLLKGAAPNTALTGNGQHDPKQSWGSEWNRLFYPLVPNPVNTPTHPISQEGIQYGEWASYTEVQLNVGVTGGNGRFNWCQESSGNSIVYRGASGLSGFYLSGAAGATTSYGWRPVLQLIRQPDQFVGEVPTAELISGDELASHIGLTEGTSQNSSEPWLKFITRDKRTLYVAKKTFRHSLSWDHINGVNAVYGDRIIMIGGKRFKVRLLKGAVTDPISGGSFTHDPQQSWDSEWNRLLYPLVPNPSGTPTHPVSQEGIRYGEWANYTETELNIGPYGGDGRVTWCQESSGTTRLRRGASGLSFFEIIANTVNVSTGWRPVLELVE